MQINLKKYNICNSSLVKSVELLEKLPQLGEPKSIIKNIFDNSNSKGEPNMKVKNYRNFVYKLMKDLLEYYIDTHNNELADIESDLTIKSDLIDIETDLNIKDLHTKIDNHIRTIYTIIKYPLSTPSIFKFTWETQITYGMLLYAFTIAYQLTYIIEEEDYNINNNKNSELLNRPKSNGRFGIFGHDIDDLVYNGFSKIKIYKDSVICNFECDS